MPVIGDRAVALEEGAVEAAERVEQFAPGRGGFVFGHALIPLAMSSAVRSIHASSSVSPWVMRARKVMPAIASTTSAARHLGTDLAAVARRLEPVGQPAGQDVDEALEQRGVQRGVRGHLPDQAGQRRQRSRGGQHGDGPAHHLAHVAEHASGRRKLGVRR